MSNNSEFISRLNESEWEESCFNLSKMILRAIESVKRDIKAGRTNDRVLPELVYPGIGDYNVIPSKRKGQCTPILITYCYNKDNLESRILESLDHVTISCPRASKYIYFLITQWDSLTPKKLEGYIDSVRKLNVEIQFIYTTKKASVQMPV